MTNRDQKDRIRERMAQTGERFSVARRAAAPDAETRTPDPGQPYELIEIEVGEHDPARSVSYHRHTESFWGRWIIQPDLETTRTAERGHPRGAFYGVAQTRRGRIAIYTGMTNPQWAPRLDDYDTLSEAQMPQDIRRRAAEILGVRETRHRDI